MFYFPSQSSSIGGEKAVAAIQGKFYALVPQVEARMNNTDLDLTKRAEDVTKYILDHVNKEYGCIFYENRVCHVRQALNLTNHKLSEEHIIQKQKKPVLTYYIRPERAQFLYEFCKLCPHLHKK